jgi:hypothetical protein
VKDFAYSFLPYKSKIGYHIARSHLYKPIFLVGCGRSGTTALGRALGQHPAIRAATAEGALINSVGGVARHYCCHELRDYVARSTALKSDLLREYLIKLIYEIVWDANYGLRGSLSNYLRHFGKSVPCWWLVKAFPNKYEFEGLAFLFPQAKFIYIYRNGMDVVNSMTKFGWFSKQPFEDLCDFWLSHMERYSYLEEGNALVVRFEDFVGTPHRVLSRIFNYLGLDMDGKATAYAESKLVHPLDQPDLSASPREVLYNRPAAYLGWTEEQRHAFKKLCEKTMMKYGYEVNF